MMSQVYSGTNDLDDCGCSASDSHQPSKATSGESCCSEATSDSHANTSSHEAHSHAHDHSHVHASVESCGDTCGCHGNPVFDGVDKRYKAVLWAVIALNGAMFVVEIIAGRMAGSQALQADALDFLGDFLTYGISLAVIGMSLRVRSTAALVKGFSLLAMGLWIFGSTLYQVLFLDVPRAEIMGVIGFMALAANVSSVLLLMRYKDGDANVRSVWLCSRNDAIGNVAVMGASVLVFYTNSALPDIVVALVMAGLFLRSAQLIITQSVQEFRQSHTISV
ncbi:cation transporter [uncultured Cohaesibacter sp.]|uniref:cation transporter n=1 Tax=uncultured Cohaesibacter sp. TaxID=1002546 RepID=UPI002AA6595B|nr:cation transporter [uncultured Cohaesibacter sp.]